MTEWCLFFHFVGRRILLKEAAKRGRQAFRPGTRANVQSHVQLYTAFAFYFGFQDFPATVEGLLAFAEFLARSFSAPGSVLNALASVRHFHLDCRMVVDAFDDREVELWKRALPLTCRAVKRQAPPVSSELLGKLCELARGLGKLGHLMAALMAVLFATMARLSSMLPPSPGGFDRTRYPTWGDARFTGDGCSILIRWAKAHQHADQGFRVPLLEQGATGTCPVRALRTLQGLLGNPQAHEPLFSFRGRRGRRGITGLVPLSMTLARQWLRLLLARLGLAKDAYTFHSFRRGACTLAFSRGVAEGDIKQLGGWRSDAVRVYDSPAQARRRAAMALTPTCAP